jgi:cell wall-associated NlpC family hydrolase
MKDAMKCTLGLLVSSVLFSVNCASTGGTPRPFPTPAGRSTPAAPVAAPESAPEPVAAISEYELVGTALDLRGVPYRNGGTDRSGFDCSGFTQYVFAQYRLSLPRDVREQFKAGKPVERNSLKAGDLIFFSTTEPGASHVGIAVGGDAFVHAPSTSGVVRVERYSSSYWAPRFVGGRRVIPEAP